MLGINTLLLFDGRAEEAMNFYISVFKDSKIESLARYGPGEGVTEGNVLFAVFFLNGQQFMAMDSGVKQDFTFTPAMSFFVSCETKQEVDTHFKKLSEGGKVPMPLDKYPFSDLYAWVEDKFGVSWQLFLPPKHIAV
jgi:predicted 3-demethylubiquinone-9 3-methyltransferase (glyoxalase superfamily)